MAKNSKDLRAHLDAHFAQAKELHRELLSHAETLPPEKAKSLRAAVHAHETALEALRQDAAVGLVEPVP